MNKKLATSLVVGAGALWGIISIFINALSNYGLNSSEISLTRTFICGILLFLFLLIYDKRLLKIKLKDIWIFIGTGIISLTLFSYCYFTTIINSQPSVAVSLLYTSPIFIMIFSAALFGEKISFKKILAIFMTVTGCSFVSGMIGGATAISLKTLLVGIGAGLFYALYSIFGRYGLERYHPLTINFYTFAFSTLGFLIFVNPVNVALKLSGSINAVVIVIVSGVLCGILPYLFYTLGLKQLDTSVAGALVAVEPLVGCIVGIAVFKDDANIIKLLGIALILASILILNINKKCSNE